jgi:hypothetical protein
MHYTKYQKIGKSRVFGTQKDEALNLSEGS